MSAQGTTLGRRLLDKRRYKDIELGGGKVRVRAMNARLAIGFVSVLPEDAGELEGKAVLEALGKDPHLVAEIVHTTCFDPETGERAFTLQEALDEVGLDWLLPILQASQEVSGIGGEDDGGSEGASLKASSE